MEADTVPKAATLIAIALALLAVALRGLLWLIRNRKVAITVASVQEHHQGGHGEISPTLPDPDPLVDFVLEKATVRNYLYVNKTVRYPYHQTMAHQPMYINHWIEIDRDYKWYLDEKARVIREQGKVVVDSLPENDEACKELLEIMADYLPKRYPTLFRREADDSITNVVTGDRFDGLSTSKGADALLIISRLVQDDFLMARERPDGKVYLVGGLIAFPGTYLLSETINKPLGVLHASVPDFNQKLLVSVERTLKRLKPDQPFERSSWNIMDDRNLFFHNIATGLPDKDLRPEDLWLRIDHQTFRKLPRTNAIIFGVRPTMWRMEDLADSPLLPCLMEKVHTESAEHLLKYKGIAKYGALLLPYLRELTQRQLDKGLITSEDDARWFREYLRDKGMPIPFKQTSLAEPTESEKRKAVRGG
ncbi:hypothetical protein BN946_scf184912.g18 [Trametes cinnabarina]|uniref:DUF3445 domain-containing protein n=1 Tax=Pycnoporus cinnabarinus TaxID=5643 RepID=A0A060SZ23_PYCCI|nr:hypothetical protein BN946_scf184912.g18 [Trametes cinnabarina]